ncbi:MAG: T9SS type A sorting domain-containing protein [Ginsengibacter sp.]
MKTLLNEKFMIALAAILLCMTSIKAQIPDKLKDLPAFKWRASILSSLRKPHEHGILNDMRCSDNAPCLKAQTTLGGSNYDQGSKMIETRDGGFIVCGLTFSNDGDFKTKDTINGDAYLAKYNKHGKLEWTKTYGGTGNDVFNDIVQTYDGGYAVVGQTTSNDGDVSGNHGGNDVWLAELNASGNIKWQKCYGGTGDEFGNAIVKTSYGGYAIATFTSSHDGDVSGNHNTDGNFDGWFIQVAPKGKLLYQHCYGGSDFDGFFAMVPSDFGSFILEGGTQSNDGDVTGDHGNFDAWVVKVNAFGKILWQKAVGGSGMDDVGSNEIAKTADGNVVINGYTDSHDGDFIIQNDTVASYVAKLNSANGNLMWSRTYNNPTYRAGFGIFATRDGGSVEAGFVGPNGFDNPTHDALISKFDKNGKEEWYKRIGGSDFDGAVMGYETWNGDLNILCQTASTDGDVKNNHGIIDEWIVKLGRCGERDEDENSISDNGAVSLTQNDLAIDNRALKLYPNPAKDVLRIEGLNTSSKTTLSLFNALGKLMQQSTATGKTYTFNLQNLAVGSYYIKIASDKTTATLKFVKQ